MTRWELAAERLRRVEQLLLDPTPEAIRETDVLLGEAAALAAAGRAAGFRELDGQAASERTDEFRVLGERVKKLLEGARRAQWIRLRLITSLTQTYTARAETKNWTPARGTVNVRM
jgi:hypothetical protein